MLPNSFNLFRKDIKLKVIQTLDYYKKSKFNTFGMVLQNLWFRVWSKTVIFYNVKLMF